MPRIKKWSFGMLNYLVEELNTLQIEISSKGL